MQDSTIGLYRNVTVISNLFAGGILLDVIFGSIATIYIKKEL